MDLKCRQLDCEYNKCYACTSEDVNITRECKCKTYKKAKQIDKDQQQDVSKTMFEKEPKIHPYRHNKDANIKCFASCLFNEAQTCKANGICVQNCNDCALCITNISP